MAKCCTVWEGGGSVELELFIGLLGVIIGASIAPMIEYTRHRRQIGEDRRLAVQKLLAELLDAGGLVAYQPDMFKYVDGKPLPQSKPS